MGCYFFHATAIKSVVFTAGEVRNPRGNLPISLALGTGTVILLYIAANFVYLLVLPLHGDPNGTTVLSRGIQYATDRKSTRLNSSHLVISYAVFCLKKKKQHALQVPAPCPSAA